MTPIILLLSALLLSSPEPRTGMGGELLTVVFLDVGQGDSILIQTPGGKNILIDGGPAGQNRGNDAGSRVILPFLRSRGMGRLDQVIATHPDLDHIGGLKTLLTTPFLEVGELLEPGVLHPSPAYQELLEAALGRPGLVYRQPRAGTALDWGKGLAAEVLHPSVLATDNNDSSVVIKLAYGHVSFLFTGDISEEVEEALIRRWGWRLKSTILKVAHHGSKHSSGKEFLIRVRPEAAVISCGAGNPFGHPSPEAVERLERTGAKIYRTDRQGDITVRTDGETFTIETEKDGEKTR